MGLQQFWFVIIAVLFIGFFVLGGLRLRRRHADGVLRPCSAQGDPEKHRRAVLNTIGPVWDGNEVWLITAGGAMFAAFPGMVRDVVLRRCTCRCW